MVAQVSIRRIGNSSGVIFPQSLLSQLGVEVGDKLDLVLDDGKIVLTAVRESARAGWAEASMVLAEAGEDGLVWPDFANAGDDDLKW